MHIGKTGRVAVSPYDRRTLWFARYAAPPRYTAPPPLDDWTGDVSVYTSLANDRIGCCTRTSYGHMIQQRCALLGQPCALTDQDIITSYAHGTGYDGTAATDRGDQILQALTDMRRTGLGPYRITAFGRINHRDPVEMRAALHLFGSLIVGVNLPRAVLYAGPQWTVPRRRTPDDAPNTYGGHAFLVTGHQRNCWMGIPWTQKVTFDYAWEELYLDEAWFVIDDLWVTATRAARNGFDLARIQADAAALSA